MKKISKKISVYRLAYGPQQPIVFKNLQEFFEPDPIEYKDEPLKMEEIYD